ncbi:MAG: hypothetical protein IPH72_32335 [Sandaracinaceae bacterium]|nr:hypothetical protein [Sandaracinaceae bacterium]
MQRAAAGRAPGDVVLMVVSKKQLVEALRPRGRPGSVSRRELRARAGGEGRRADDLEGLRIHLIGHLQRNKVKPIVGSARVDTVDSLRLLDALGAECARQGVVLPICPQVNVAGEERSLAAP